MNVILRDYQRDLVVEIRDAYRHGFRAPLLQLSTGAGKTIIFCDIVERVARADHSAYILVHRQELLRQASDHLNLLGIPHGNIAAGRAITGDPIQIASVQTLVRRLDKLPRPDLIIIDEAHHSNAASWRKIISTWSSSRLLGVTATPMRLDGTGLGKQSGGYYDYLICGPSTKELIRQGYLSRPVVYAPPIGADLTGIKTVAGDFDMKETSQRIDKPTITGCAIEHYSRICGNAPAIAFCASIKHAEHIANQFNAAGIAAADLHGGLDDNTRKHRIASLGNGQLRVLTSCDLISEGTDIPIVTTAILLRPTQSPGLYLQQCGRALRPFPGKAAAIILDHVGNWERHGLPDESRQWSLDSERKLSRNKKQGLQIRMCEQCYAVIPATVLICPQCGAKKDVKERKLNQVPGELCEVTEDRAAAARINLKREQGMARSLQDLLRIAAARRYNPGWAFNVYNARKAKEYQKAISV